VINSPAGTEFIIASATQYQLTGQVFIDGNGMSGPVTIVSGPSGGANNITSAGDTITVMPRTPTALSGTATGTFADLGSSAVYSISATGNSILHYSLTANDPNATPASAVLGSGGTWRNDFLGANHLIVPSGTFNVVAVNLGGMGYNYTLTGTTDLVTATSEGNDTTNNNAATATPAAVPFEVSPATVSGTGNHDYFKITISAAQANKRLHVVTDLGNLQTDTAVDIVSCTNTTTSYTDDGTGSGMGAGPIDGSECSFFTCNSNGEDVLSLPLAAGNYCVDISDGQFFNSADSDYIAGWWLE
jgi:hypothetical protein